MPSPAGPDGNGDWAVFEFFRNQVIAAGQNPALLSMYIVTFNSDLGEYEVWAYDYNPEHNNDGGRKVNPEAQPCPL